MIEKFCEELQELLDRYKTQLSVPAIMRNAQRIFHNTLSIQEHPELHPQSYIEAGVWKEAEKKSIPCKTEIEICKPEVLI